MDGISIKAVHAGNSLQWIALYLYENVGGKMFVPKPLEWRELSQEDVWAYDEPLLKFHELGKMRGRDTLQELMDSLWTVGIRPTEGQGSAGAMAATQKHLEDLRTLNGRLLTLVEQDRGEPK
jgi:hypothetical protein